MGGFWALFRLMMGLLGDLYRVGNRWARFAITLIVLFPLVSLASALEKPTVVRMLLLVLPLMGVIWAVGSARIMRGKLSQFILVGFVLSAAFIILGMPSDVLSNPKAMMFLPAASIVALLLSAIDPAILAVMGAFGPTRRALAVLSTVVGAEMAMGVYFAYVPIGSDLSLLALLLGLGIAVLFLGLGAARALGSAAVGVFTFLVVVATIIFFIGGTDKAEERMRSALQWVKTAIPKGSSAATAAVAASALSTASLTTADYETISLAGQPLVKAVYVLPANGSTKWLRLNPEDRPRAKSCEFSTAPDVDQVFTPMGKDTILIPRGTRKMGLWEYIRDGQWFRIAVTEASTITVTVAR